MVFPFVVLFTAIYTYTNLSEKNEIVALQAIGISPLRLIVPTIAFSIIVAIFMFILNEAIVPPTNYQAAILTEKAMNIDRSKLAKYHNKQIYYPEFIKEKDTKNQHLALKYLFYADGFDGTNFKDVTLLVFKKRFLRKIVISRTARWNDNAQKWHFFQGKNNIVNKDGSYGAVDKFDELILDLPKNILDYVNHNRDNREMNIFECYQRLKIIKKIGDSKSIRQLKVNIERRKSKPSACCVFAFVGSVIGIKMFKSKSRVFGISAVIVFGYYTIECVTASFAMAGIIPIFLGVWLPNLLCFCIGWCFLVLTSSSMKKLLSISI